MSCTLSGDSQGLSVTGASVRLVNGGATVALDIAGTPTVPGYAAFAVSVDGVQIGTARAKVYAMSEMPIEGLPVTWEFCPVKGSTRGRQCPESPAARLGNRVAQFGFGGRPRLHHGRRSRCQDGFGGQQLGLQRRARLSQGALYRRLLAAEDSGEIPRLRHEDQLYGQHRRFGLFGGVLPDRVLADGRLGGRPAVRRAEPSTIPR